MKKEDIAREQTKQNVQTTSNNISYNSKIKRVRRREPILSRIRKK